MYNITNKCVTCGHIPFKKKEWEHQDAKYLMDVLERPDYLATIQLRLTWITPDGNRYVAIMLYFYARGGGTEGEWDTSGVCLADGRFFLPTFAKTNGKEVARFLRDRGYPV